VLVPNRFHARLPALTARRISSLVSMPCNNIVRRPRSSPICSILISLPALPISPTLAFFMFAAIVGHRPIHPQRTLSRTFTIPRTPACAPFELTSVDALDNPSLTRAIPGSPSRSTSSKGAPQFTVLQQVSSYAAFTSAGPAAPFTVPSVHLRLRSIYPFPTPISCSSASLLAPVPVFSVS
jgi:hypothetical protein